MPAQSLARTGHGGSSLLPRIIETTILLLPAALLLMCALRNDGPTSTMLWVGTCFQALVSALSFASRHNRRESMGPSIITLYVIATGWLWLGTRGSGDWFPHLAQALLLVMPLLVFALQILTDSGAPAIRRARSLASALASRRDWPSDLADCRTLPEVKALREALHIDAAPALAL